MFHHLEFLSRATQGADVNFRKSITAIVASSLVIVLGGASASFATNATPAPKKPSISGVSAGVESSVAHETTEGTKTKAIEKAKNNPSVALTAWRRGHLDAKRVFKADLAAAKIVEKAAKHKAATSATKIADLAAAKKAFADAKAVAKAKFDAAITALGPKPVK